MDKHLYNRILLSSDWYYNRGLTKARIRDLSGAAEDLRTAIKYNKRNIQARNLLGLVYYEAGEVCQALCQWTISTNFQALSNPASEYLEQIMADQAWVETVNATVRKYNQALIHARHSSDDLAIIQLKQVIEAMPNYISAHLLLALVLMRGKQYAQARRTLREVLRMDVNNLDALRYMDEVRQQLRTAGRRSRNQEKQGKDERKRQRRFFFSDEEEEQYNRRNYGYMLFGLVVGVLFMAVLIVPNAREKAVEESGMNRKQYERQVSTLETQVAELQQANQTAQQELDRYGAVPDDFFETASANSFEEAYTMYEEGAYSSALEKFTEAYQLNPENGRALFFMGKMNDLLDQDEEAKNYFTQVIEKFPDTEQSEEAERLIKEMDGE